MKNLIYIFILLLSTSALTDNSCKDLSLYIGQYHIDKVSSDECALEKPALFGNEFNLLVEVFNNKKTYWSLTGNGGIGTCLDSNCLDRCIESGNGFLLTRVNNPDSRYTSTQRYFYYKDTVTIYRNSFNGSECKALYRK